MELKEHPCFDELAWRAQCESVIQAATERSSQSYDIYVERLSSVIDAMLNQLPETHRAMALQIAKEWGYATPEEREEAARWCAENGYCDHGIELGCCPAGCGSGPDD